MPYRIKFTAILISDFFICVSSYMIAGGVFNHFLDVTVSYLASLLSLASIAVIVFYVKKWLSKEDERLNKNGGLVSFIKAFWKDRSKKDCGQ